MSASRTWGSHICKIEPAKEATAEFPSIGPTYGNIFATRDFGTPAERHPNLFAVFEASAKQFADRPCLGKRIDGKGPYVWESYKVC